MKIKDLTKMLIQMEALQHKGGKIYKDVNHLLNSEPTTENIRKIKEYLTKYTLKHIGE